MGDVETIAGGSQSAVDIMSNGGGGGTTTRVVLLTDGLILAGC